MCSLSRGTDWEQFRDWGRRYHLKSFAVAEWFVRRMSFHIILGLHETDLQKDLVKENQDSKQGSFFIFQHQKYPMITLSHFNVNILGITAQTRCILLLVGSACENKRILLSSLVFSWSAACFYLGLGKQALKLLKVVLQKELSGQAEDGILPGKQAYLSGAVKP